MTAFFDTNILVHAQQSGSKGGRERALLAEGGTLGAQVLNGFAAVLFKKHGKSWRQSRPASLRKSTGRLFTAHRSHAAALSAACDTPYTEDMQAGRGFGGLTIVNPFAP